jgi:hypothetical protein
LGQRDGGIKLNLNQGVLKYLMHIFFTGGRTFKITYTLSDGTNKSVTTSKYSKGSYTLDVLDLAGLSSDDERARVRSIVFQQSGANGGARIYEMYVSIPDGWSTGILNVHKNGDIHKRVVKCLQDGRLVIEKDGNRFNALGSPLR